MKQRESVLFLKLKSCSDSLCSTDSLNLRGACGARVLQIRENELELAPLRSSYALELKRSVPLHPLREFSRGAREDPNRSLITELP
jgi:hypothetical protein